MATFNMSGDAGVFVKTNPYEERQKAYYQHGLDRVLGNFVGSVKQNTAVFNRMKKINGALQVAANIPVSQPLDTKAPPSANPVGQSNAYVSGINNPSMNSLGQTPVPGKNPTNTAGGLNGNNGGGNTNY